MAEDHEETGRERVRRVLINPLLRQGMRKQTRMSEPDYSDMLVRLSEKLSHLGEADLRGLVPWVTRFAKGKERNQWPDEVGIVAQGYALQPPPPRKNEFVISVLRSRAGARARDMGYLPELYMAIAQFGPPFSKYSIDRMEREAAENRAELGRVSKLIDRGTATQERRQWMKWYLDHEAAALEIMAGDAREDAA